MALPHMTRPYETWAPVLGRLLLASAFLVGALMKIPGTEIFTQQVAATAAVGIPLASVAVTLAFVLEVVAGIALAIGWKARLSAFVLMLYTILLTVLFHMSFADPMAFGFFMSHLYLIGGLLYASVYGAQHVAVNACPLPQELTKKA